MFISKLTRSKYTRSVVAVVVCLSLIPLLSSPTEASPSQPKALEPHKMAPLGKGKAEVTKAKDPNTGEFSNPPIKEGLIGNSSLSNEKRDHFDPAKSRLISQNYKSNTYDNGDGTYSVDYFGSPVNFRDKDGNWQKIQAELVNKDDTISTKGSPLEVELAKRPTAGHVGKLSVGDKSLSFGFEGLSTNSSISITNEVTYLDVAPGVDLSYQLIGNSS